MIRTFVSVLAVLALCACGKEVAVVPVLQHDQCQMIDAGVTRVAFEDLAKIRGLTLIGMTANDDGPQDDLTLVAVSNGQRPTAGYGLTLNDSAHLDDGTLTIEVTSVEPAADALVPQVLTHPCVVVGIPRIPVSRVLVVDQHARQIGAVELD